jgi:hypothetical protein
MILMAELSLLALSELRSTLFLHANPSNARNVSLKPKAISKIKIEVSQFQHEYGNIGESHVRDKSGARLTLLLR